MYINQNIENIILAKTIDGSIVILNAPKSFLNEVQKNEIVILDPNNWIKNGVFRATLLFSKFAYNNISKIDVFYFNISFAIQLIEGFQVFKEKNIYDSTIEIKNTLKEEKLNKSEISEVDISKTKFGEIFNNDNIKDKNIFSEPKGKTKYGYSKLNKEQVIEIKKLLISGELSNKKISEIFNVSKTCISDIKVGNTYKDVIIEQEKIFYTPETELEKNTVKTVSKFYSKLDIEKVKEIKRLLITTDLSCKEIGLMFGVSSSSIWDIKNDRSWRHVI